MEYNEIKQLITDMENSNLEEIIEHSSELEQLEEAEEAVKSQSTKKKKIINLKKAQTAVKVVENKVEETPAITNTLQDTKVEENLKQITSPMVGTFYSKPSTTAEPFVKVGDKVKKGDVLCIIEAMKLMNEIESDVDGEIAEICYQDEDLVEYGSVLFKIR